MKSAIQKIVLTCMVLILPLCFLAAQDYDADSKRFGQDFIHALNTRSLDSLLALKPTVVMWKVISPEEYLGLSDEQIELQANQRSKMEFYFNNITGSAKQHGIDLTKLTYHSVFYEELGGIPVAVRVIFEYAGKSNEFQVNVVSYNYRLYMDRIQNSYLIFDHLK